MSTEMQFYSELLETKWGVEVQEWYLAMKKCFKLLCVLICIHLCSAHANFLIWPIHNHLNPVNSFKRLSLFLAFLILFLSVCIYVLSLYLSKKADLTSCLFICKWHGLESLFSESSLMVSGYSNGLNARFCSHYRQKNDFCQF